MDSKDVLYKISKLKLESWNYKGQNPKQYRHYGPTAQEFFAAFGNDGIGIIGNDTTINSADFDGINLMAIQALEKRTAELRNKTAELESMKTELKAVKERLAKIEAMLQNKTDYSKL